MMEAVRTSETSVYFCNTVTYLGCSIHDGTLLNSKSQYTTVKHSQKAFKHASGQSIVGLSVRLHTTATLRRIFHH
jgi:hypothetical protein